MQYWYLLVLCALLVTIFIYFEHKEKYILAVLFKGLSSICFVTLGLLLSKNLSSTNNPVIIGLILGMVADILLNLRFVLKKIGKPVFLVGILVFLSGHIFYIINLINIITPNLIIWASLVSIILTALLMIWIFKQITAGKAFKIFGVFYIGSVTYMTILSLFNLFSLFTISNLLFAIGAVLFLVSDIVLILNTFGKKTLFSLRITNLSLYYIGQLLIALSLGYLL